MSSFRLPRLSKKYLEVPQYITQTALEDIAEVIDAKDRTIYREAFKAVLESGDTAKNNTTLSIFGDEAKEKEQREYGVLSVEGTLTCKTTGWEALCGGGSYETLVADMKQYASDGLKTVYMIVDSGGGEAYRCISTSRELRKIADDNDMKLIGYVDGSACSAAYALLTSCHEAIANPDSHIGSVGAVSTLVNDTGALEKQGYKRHFITAGKSKVPFDEDGEFKSEFLEERQKSINNAYEKFVSLVNENRPTLSLDAIYSTEAKVFIAEEALSLGLVDKLMEVSEFQDEYLYSSGMSTEDKRKEYSVGNLKTTSQKENLMSEQVDLAEFDAMKAELAALKAEKLLAEANTKKEELTNSLSNATFLTDVEGVVGFLMEADTNQATLLNTIIADASSALEKQSEEFSSKLSTKEEEYKASLKEEQEKLTALELEKEQLKSEFVKADAIRGEEKEENLVSLDHKEKLSRAVAQAKAKKNS